MRWPWQRELRERQVLVSIGDPNLVEFFSIGQNFSGITVGETEAIGISAVWRAISLISGTVGTLPLKTIRKIDDTTSQQVSSFLDDPGGIANLSPFEWKETILWHLLLHGNAFLAHIFSEGGALIGLLPIHPLMVSMETELTFPPISSFGVTLQDGQRRIFTQENMTHIKGPSLDGIHGLSPISVARNSFGTHIAGDRSAARMFNNGALISGIVTSEEDVTTEDAKIIKSELNAKVKGWENAGDIAFVNRKLRFTPWTQSAADAQFLESRQFQIEEVARWYGIPPFELMQTEKQTSWGTGIEAQQRGLGRTVLLPWAMRMEQKLSMLLPSPRKAEFDFSGIERPTPELEIQLLIAQVQAGILTINEARQIRNLPPLPEEPEEPEPEGNGEINLPDAVAAIEEVLK